MSDIKETYALILEQEQEFAATLAAQVLNKPQLSLWMILIPIFFVFYFNDLSKYKNGCNIFAENYLIDKKRALNEANESVNKGRKPDFRALAGLSNMNSATRERHENLMTVLVEHYTILLNTDGEDFPSLTRSAYGSLTNYLLFLNRLNQAEREINRALKPDIKGSGEEINDIVSRMASLSEKFRRDTAERIFPQLEISD